MKWRGRRGSKNVIDRRGQRSGVSRAGGVGGLGIVGTLIVLAIGYFMGVDVRPFLSGDVGPAGTEAQQSDAEDQAGRFVSVVLADTETVWAEIFAKQVGSRYRPPELVLFSGATRSPCGGASGATGPFYCPADNRAYLDTSFFAVMKQRLGAGGDFAAAYVVAHEIAHHVQDELGILGKANQTRQRVSQVESNRISVMIELQADCFSGIWARYAQDRLGTIEPGDIEEAINAARRIGDDVLQASAGRRPMPHTFTHGSSEQRQRWFMQGYRTGDLNQCNTFGAQRL